MSSQVWNYPPPPAFQGEQSHLSLPQSRLVTQALSGVGCVSRADPACSHADLSPWREAAHLGNTQRGLHKPGTCLYMHFHFHLSPQHRSARSLLHVCFKREDQNEWEQTRAGGLVPGVRQHLLWGLVCANLALLPFCAPLTSNLGWLAGSYSWTCP